MNVHFLRLVIMYMPLVSIIPSSYAMIKRMYISVHVPSKYIGRSLQDWFFQVGVIVSDDLLLVTVHKAVQ